MRQRITNADLNQLLTILNRYAKRRGAPLYYIDGAYGGVKLVQYYDHDTTAIREISTDGYGTKRQLHAWMSAYIDGIEYANGVPVEDEVTA